MKITFNEKLVKSLTYNEIKKQFGYNDVVFQMALKIAGIEEPKDKDQPKAKKGK